MRTTEATYEGRKYSIPEIWLIGMGQQGFSIPEAIAHWAWQTELGEREES